MTSSTGDLGSLGRTRWHCPRCDTVLETVQYEYAIMETCPKCHGEWCDRLELLQITKTLEEQFTADEVAQVRGIDTVTITAQEEGHALTCPKCPDVELRSYNYGATSGLILDKCPVCEGVWLDDSELEHAQILIEEWEKKLDEDLATHGVSLTKLRAAFTDALGDAHPTGPIGRFLGYNALMRWYERMTL